MKICVRSEIILQCLLLFESSAEVFVHSVKLILLSRIFENLADVDLTYFANWLSRKTNKSIDQAKPWNKNLLQRKLTRHPIGRIADQSYKMSFRNIKKIFFIYFHFSFSRRNKIKVFSFPIDYVSSDDKTVLILPYNSPCLVVSFVVSVWWYMNFFPSSIDWQIT